VRKTLIGTLCIAIVLYAAAPFWTAWSIYTAVHNNDVATLQSKVVWPSVRQSLRESIVNHTALLPAAIDAGSKVRPTVWQRIKHIFGESMLDRFMDRYITAEGLPQLYRVKQSKRRNAQRPSPLVDQSSSANQRFSNLLQHVKRIDFKSLGHLEIEIKDRNKPDRNFVVTLERLGFEWKLTRIIVKMSEINSKKEDIALNLEILGEEERQYINDMKKSQPLRQYAARDGVSSLTSTFS